MWASFARRTYIAGSRTLLGFYFGLSTGQACTEPEEAWVCLQSSLLGLGAVEYDVRRSLHLEEISLPGADAGPIAVDVVRQRLIELVDQFLEGMSPESHRSPPARRGGHSGAARGVPSGARRCGGRSGAPLHGGQISPRDRGIGVAYLPIRRYGRATLAVRLASPSLAQAASVRQQAQTIVGDVQSGPMTTISQELERSIARERLTSGIALFLAVLVVAIGCVGIYALMNYDVTRRQREFGVRLALGAGAGRLVATVLREGAAIVAPALAIGLPAGLATSRLLASQLYGVAASDPWTLSSVAVLLSVVAMSAVFRPAWLASRIDPMALLRHE